jgi:cytochrome d ubiquinol oxidase subunit II
MWDWGIFIGSFVPPLVIGVAFGNLLQGVPFHVDEYMRLYYTGNFFQLLNPFGLLAGVVSVAMIITQGATYLQMRTVGELHLRSARRSGCCAGDAGLLRAGRCVGGVRY